MNAASPAKRYIVTELGTEKLCPRCGEYWPADREFFWPRGHGHGLQGWCRACTANCERGRKRRRVAGVTGG